jgi:hypothetical protein
MELVAKLALLAAVVLVLVALLAPNATVAPAAQGDERAAARPPRPRPRRPAKKMLTSPALAGAVARVRRGLSTYVRTRVERRIAERRAATNPRDRDDAANASPQDTEAEAGPAPVSSAIVDWPLLVDDSARDLTLERRFALLRTLDAIGAPWCAPILRRAEDQEQDPQVLTIIATALAAHGATEEPAVAIATERSAAVQPVGRWLRRRQRAS